MGKKSKNKSKLQTKSLPKEERKERNAAIAQVQQMLSELEVRASPSRCYHWDSSKRQDVLLFLAGEEPWSGCFKPDLSLLLEWSLPENKSNADALLGMAVELFLRYESCRTRFWYLSRLIFGHIILEKLIAVRDVKPLTFDEAIAIHTSEMITFADTFETDLDFCRYLSKRIKCECLKGIKRELKKVPELSMCMNPECREMKEKKDLLLCSKCKIERYCSRECQVADWGRHKVVCKYIRQERKDNELD